MSSALLRWLRLTVGTHQTGLFLAGNTLGHSRMVKSSALRPSMRITIGRRVALMKTTFGTPANRRFSANWAGHIQSKDHTRP